MTNAMKLPCMVRGELNVLLSEEEKIQGLPILPTEYDEFAFCINSCGLFDLGYTETLFTWWNGKANKECVFKRLDRILVDQDFQNIFSQIEVEHLTS